MSNIYQGTANGAGMLLDQSQQAAFKTTNELTLKPLTLKTFKYRQMDGLLH